MADDRNYIGIAFGADVSDLKSGLALAEKQISNATTSFEKSTVGMEDWQKSIEGVEAKTKQLSDILVAQNRKLAGLKAEYKKVSEEQGASSEAALKLQQQIKRQQTVVNATQREFINYSDTLDKAKRGTVDLSEVTLKGGKAIENIGDSADKASKDFDELGDGAKTAGENVNGGFGKAAVTGIVGGIAAIGAAAVAAVGSFLALAGSTRETRENFNKLETGFTTAGHSAEDAQKTYKDLYGILGDEGQATEAAAHLAQLANTQEELAQWTDIATGVYATFGDSLPIENLTEAANETAKTGKITGGLADALNWAGENEEEFQAKLDAASSEQERQALITQTLNGLYSDQSDKFKELNGDIIAAREADAALTQAMAELGEIAEPIMTMLKTLTTELLTQMQPFVELIGTGLKGAFEGTAGATDTLAEGLSGILSLVAEKAVEILPTVLETLASLISTLLPALISKLGEIIPILIQTLAAQLPTILQAIISGFSQILETIGGMLPELIPVILDAILTIVMTLLDNIDQLVDAGISLLMGLADGLIAAIPRLIDKIPTIIEKLLGAISRNLPKLVQAGIELIVKLAGGLIKAIPQLIAKIPEIISALVSGFGDYFSNMGEVGRGLLEGIWEGIKDGASWLKEKITGFAGNVADWFKDTFKINSPSRLMEDEVGTYVGQGVIPTSPRALSRIKKSISKFSDYVTDNMGNIKAGLTVEANGTGKAGAGRAMAGNTVVNAGMTVHYNGKLSRKELKRIENDNYIALRTKLRAEGAL